MNMVGTLANSQGRGSSSARGSNAGVVRAVISHPWTIANVRKIGLPAAFTVDGGTVKDV